MTEQKFIGVVFDEPLPDTEAELDLLRDVAETARKLEDALKAWLPDVAWLRGKLQRDLAALDQPEEEEQTP